MEPVMENVNSSNSVENMTAQAADATPKNGSSGTLATCAACGGESSVDSRFCRHCGAALRSSDTSNAPIAVTAQNGISSTQNGSVESSITAPVQSLLYGLPGAETNTPIAEAAPEAHGASYEIDQRRARQLLDRAFMLAERGDMAAAILACRQSVALAPDAAPGFSMLGLLLERSGDLEHAVAAYQKVLKIAPDSRLENESLQRLQATLGQQKGAGFHFDDKELFDDGAGGQSPTAVATPLPPVLQPPGIVPPAALNRTGVVNGGAVVASTGAASQFPSSTLNRDATTPATGFNTPPTGPIPLTALDFGVAPDAPVSPWQRLMRQPSFFFRGFPLVATTALGLMFMLWSRQSIVSQQAQNQAAQSGGAVPSNLAPDITNNDAANAGTTQPAANAPVADNGNSTQSNGTTGANGGQAFPVMNRPTSGAGATSGGTSGGSPPIARRGSERNKTSGGSRPTPRFPSNSRVSAPPREAIDLPPAQLILPPPQVNQGQPARPPIQALPQNSGDSGASSSGGSPLNPAGASGRGYIRITPARPSTSTAPVRPANRAVEAERATSSDIRSGRSERAIQNITSAIEGGGDAAKDTGWRYQQRALLFLEKGDNQRAADDFQTAINSYRDQIRRGERVSESRAGIQACQSGLRLALSNLRR